MGKPTKNQKVDDAILKARQTRAQAAQTAIAVILKQFNCELRAQLSYGTSSIQTYVAVVAKPDEIQKAAEDKAKEPEPDGNGQAEASA